MTMTTMRRAIPNSTMHIWTPPCMGIDIGEKHTGIVCRTGIQAVWAATVSIQAPPDIDDVPLWSKYWTRVADTAVKGWKSTFAGDVKFRVAAEHPKQPELYHRGKRNHIPLRRWVSQYGLIGVLIGRMPGIVLIPPKGLSDSHLAKNGGTGNAADYVPPELIGGTRPPEFGVNEMPRNERRNEQSAFGVAGMGFERESTIKYLEEP